MAYEPAKPPGPDAAYQSSDGGDHRSSAADLFDKRVAEIDAARANAPAGTLPVTMSRADAIAEKEKLLGNADFRERYLRGEHAAIKQMTEVTSVLAQPEDPARVARQIEAAGFQQAFQLNSTQIEEIAAWTEVPADVAAQARAMLDRNM